MKNYKLFKTTEPLEFGDIVIVHGDGTVGKPHETTMIPVMSHED
jgi:hypothetical protein